MWSQTSSKTYQVMQCLPLASYLLALNLTTLDFLSLDIQGFEEEVLYSIPYDKVKVRVIAVEFVIQDDNGDLYLGEIDRNFVKNMKSKGYFLVDFDHERNASEEEVREADQLNTRKPLPDVAIARRVWHKYTGKKWQGLQLPVLTSIPLGRLGNFMGQYATLLALGRIYGATVRLHPGMRDEMINIFPDISMNLLPGPFNRSEWILTDYVSIINHASYEAAAAGLLGAKRFLLIGHPFEIQLFNTFREDIIKEFTFSKDIQNQVKAFWTQHKRNDSEVIVGFHVRRTDYINFIKMFQSKMPEYAYFQRAMAHYKNKFPKVRFLVASDDMDYVKKAFADYSDVLYTPGSPPELDMALLASGNHSIITVGSFGFWCGYLAGGEVVYPNLTARHDFLFQKSWYDLGHLDFFVPLPSH
ncbi:galactoside alpha-(1,2)-fucosyltransferase 2-like [Macrobrachium nipponense]|uniref:galactoside alpha-(1,2)-fucosyltransferase 2-like n=1 Tax=Macrobrachium nipponense TaxID=159736 RepID=UPI0030C883F0